MKIINAINMELEDLKKLTLGRCDRIENIQRKFVKPFIEHLKTIDRCSKVTIFGGDTFHTTMVIARLNI